MLIRIIYIYISFLLVHNCSNAQLNNNKSNFKDDRYSFGGFLNFDQGEFDFEVLSNIDLNGADALFVSCTALPVLPIIEKLEKKLNKIVLSSNQALIWDTLEKIGKNNSVEGFGKLFNKN